MSHWPSMKGSRLLRAAIAKGWRPVNQNGSHIKLMRAGQHFSFCFSGQEIGPKMIARICKELGLTVQDL